MNQELEPPPSFDATEEAPPSFDSTEPVKSQHAKVAKVSSEEPPPSFDATEPTEEEKHSTLGQQIGTAVEGLGHGFAGPLFTGAELGTAKLAEKFGFDDVAKELSPESQEAREKANPLISGVSKVGGLGAGLLTGVGELGLLAKAGEAVTGIGEAAALAPTAVKIGAAAMKGFTEMYGLQLGEEASDWMLGKGDPEHPVASALSNSGYSGLLGAGISAAFPTGGVLLKNIADTKLGTKAGQLLADFGSRWKFNSENPNLLDTVHKEIHDFFTSTSEAADSVYGARGLKSQAIERLVPEMSDSIKNQNNKIATKLQSKITEMVKDPESYPARLTQKLSSNVNDWMEVATNPSATSNEVFNATQELKQTLQDYSKFDKQVGPLSPEKDFINLAKDLQYDLVRHLEDTGVWGKAGELQKGVNKAFSDFLPAQKDFVSKFTSKELGESLIDEGKLNTYINQIDKATGARKQSILKNYVDAAEKYRNKIADLHNNLGVESPIPPVSLNAIKSTYGSLSKGAELADDLFHSGIGKLMGHIAGGVSGGFIGHATGLPGAEAAGVGAGAQAYVANKLAPLFENTLGRFIKKGMVPVVLKTLGEGRPTALAEALTHAENVARGSTALETGVNSLFTGAKLTGQHFYHEKTDEKNREKIKKFIKEGGLNKQIQNTLNKQNKQKSGVQKFAEGGEVKSPSLKKEISTPLDESKLGEVYPDQNMLMNVAKGRVYNYLNKVQPKENQPKLIFDEEQKDHENERSYERAIDIANKPLSILSHIKKGTLEPEHVRHLSEMWPEVHSQLSKKITAKLMEKNLKGEKPAYHIRQGLSMLLGTPLESTMTPSAIQAAQSVFQKQKMQAQAAPTKAKKGTSGLSDYSKQYLTATQSDESRMSKTKP